jgi:hypothetical protein
MDFVSIASIASSFLATFGGIVVSGKLTSYRIEQLEKKVEKLADINEKVVLMEEKIKVANHRIDDMEKELRAIAAK